MRSPVVNLHLERIKLLEEKEEEERDDEMGTGKLLT